MRNGILVGGGGRMSSLLAAALLSGALRQGAPIEQRRSAPDPFDDDISDLGACGQQVRVVRVQAASVLEIPVPASASPEQVQTYLDAMASQFPTQPGTGPFTLTLAEHPASAEAEEDEDAHYAVLPLKAITNAHVVADSFEEAAQGAAGLISHGGHKQVGRSQAIVKVMKVVDAQRPVAAEPRDITDLDYNNV